MDWQHFMEATIMAIVVFALGFCVGFETAKDREPGVSALIKRK